MRAIYNLLFLFGFWLSSPFYFFKMWRRGQWAAGFGQRFGRYNARLKQSLTNRHVIWFHAVSVGEVNICTQLIQALEPRAPNLKILVSTTTSTGMGELRRKLPSHIEKIYYPVDSRRVVAKALGSIHPEAIVLVEAEIWPNFIWRAQEGNIPIFLINARLSERSYRGYKSFSSLFRPLFAAFAGVGCQNEQDAARLVELGCRPEAVKILGNLKYDAAQLDERRLLDVPRLFRQLGVPEDALVLVGGSTHAGEEKILAELFQRLKTRFPKLFLVVVPRHFERSRDAGKDLEAAGVNFIYRNEVTPQFRAEGRSWEALLVNTTGELKYFYEFATVIFVGKSLTAEGGQNPIEPGALAKPILFGPQMQNFKAISEALVRGGGAIQVADPADLERQIESLLNQPERRRELGENAVQVIRQNLGAIEKTVEMILQQLPADDNYLPLR